MPGAAAASPSIRSAPHREWVRYFVAPERDDGLVTDERLPVPLEPINDADRVGAVARLRDLLGSGELSFDRFSSALDQALAASTHGELESAFTGLPLPVRMSPASRRLLRPVVIEARMSALDLGQGFQLGAETSVVASIGSVRLDLVSATWDAHEVDLRLEAHTGSIDVVVPRGVAVQLVHVKGQVVLEDLEPPVPGAPVLRVEATAKTGAIRLTHNPDTVGPKSPRKRRWWRRH